MTVDAHVHAFTARDATNPRATSEVFPPERAEPIEQLLAESFAHQVSAVVLVALAGQEQYVIEACQTNPGRVFSVMTLEGRSVWPSPATLDQWRASGVLGLRLLDLSQADTLAGDPVALDYRLDQMAEAGMLLSVYLPEAQLPRLETLATRHPGLRLVLNHSGCPCGSARVDRWRRPQMTIDWHAPWRTQTLQLSRFANVCVCLSGAYAFDLSGPPYREANTWAGELIGAFGAERLAVGTDAPWIQAEPGYSVELQAFTPALAQLPASEHQLVLAASAMGLTTSDGQEQT